jgi:hypothetical protein
VTSHCHAGLAPAGDHRREKFWATLRHCDGRIKVMCHRFAGRRKPLPVRCVLNS